MVGLYILYNDFCENMLVLMFVDAVLELLQFYLIEMCWNLCLRPRLGKIDLGLLK